ncbi:hypothetical protein JXA63_05500 [Candidatus Woesebacteria bacterium]|nr:hypothetical protein [Candidatus Woesebacteria bacterium]
MTNTNKKTAQQNTKYKNVLETLKSFETNVKDTVKEDIIKGIQKDAIDQIFGPRNESGRSMTGTIEAGESIRIAEILSGERGQIEKQKKQVFVEKRLLEEERLRVQEKTNQLRLELKVIMDEVLVLSQSTQELGEEIQIAAMQAPIEPGEYHIAFFEKLLSFITSFRKKIEKASTWLAVSNQRAQKKNYWAQYKKHGSKFLLSGEHYLTRSAG